MLLGACAASSMSVNRNEKSEPISKSEDGVRIFFRAERLWEVGVGVKNHLCFMIFSALIRYWPATFLEAGSVMLLTPKKIPITTTATQTALPISVK